LLPEEGFRHRGDHIFGVFRRKSLRAKTGHELRGGKRGSLAIMKRKKKHASGGLLGRREARV